MTSSFEQAILCLSQALNKASTSGWTIAAVVLSIAILAYNLRPSVTRNCKASSMEGPSLVIPDASVARTAPLPGQVKVSKILIHPIKSCRGISVQTAKYTPEGLENDRLWCIIDAVKVAVLTAREIPKMVLITSSIEPDGTLKVKFPEGSGCEEFCIPLNPTEDTLKSWSILPKVTLWPTHDPVDGYICESSVGPKDAPSVVLSQYLEKPVHLIYKGPQPRPIDPTTAFPDLKATAKYQDMYPMLILSEESTSAVEKHLRVHVGTQGIDERWKEDKVPIERFRPNIVLSGGGPFAEDHWEQIKIGLEDAPLLTLVSKCTRCLLPNVSPETGERDKAVPYKVLMKFRTGLDPTQKMKPCVGCNAVPDGHGTLNVGDWVHVKKMI